MEHIPRIIVKTKYLKGASHKEYYVDIATREGAEMVQSSNGEKLATPKQKKLIEELIKDFPDIKSMFEYEDYLSQPTRDHASELITMVMDQNIVDVSTKENLVAKSHK